MMQRLENLLQLSLGIEPVERMKSPDLGVGYEVETNSWEVIVKYTGDVLQLYQKYPQIRIKELLGQYAILKVPQEVLVLLSEETAIDFIEKPKMMYFEMLTGKQSSCMVNKWNKQENIEGLYGKGTLIAVIDSGIDFTDLEFLHMDGTTKLKCLYDQNTNQEYDENTINQLLKNENYAQLPGRDMTGHGTAVAKIACGNSGVAPEAELIVVKMGISDKHNFPRTTQLMEAVDYVIKKSIHYQMPVAVNISFGNNYGDHRGNSLLETYLNEAAVKWKNVICVGSGNEGLAATHKSGQMKSYETQMIEIGVSNFETAVNLQIWKHYADDVDFELITPTGKNLGSIQQNRRIGRFDSEDTRILFLFGQPSYYNLQQEIYLDFAPRKDYIAPGSWWLKVNARQVKLGRYDMWLPSASSLNFGTGFLQPEVEGTQTIPSTASRVISVGAYDAKTDQSAPFSGRGQFTGVYDVKPDLAAAGVDVKLNEINTVTGTSFATPFVTGAAALLMQWGIVNGNDPYLYGEKLKAYLIRGARQLQGLESPNTKTGWGALCVRDSLPK